MSLHLFFADHSRIADSPWAEQRGFDSVPKVPEGCPIILNANFWPLQPWSEFLRLYAQNISLNSARAYGRDLFRLAQYLDERAIDIVDVNNDHLLEYREYRFEHGLGSRSWQRETVVLRAFFEFLVCQRLIDDTPWLAVGRYSVVRPRPTSHDMQVRALSRADWLQFKNVGLGGQMPDGSMDSSFRGRSPLRDTTAAELALTTGMRLQEWSSVLLPEILQAEDGGASLLLEETTKGKRRRTVYIPEPTVRDVDLYVRTERARTVRRAQGWLTKNSKSLAHVEEIDPMAGRVTYCLHGHTYRRTFHQIPIPHRSVLVAQLDDRIEPLSLFIGTSGKPPSKRSWHGRFSRANERLRGFSPDGELPRSSITPHDLRHTFAIVMLQNLQIRAMERSHPRAQGQGTISEHIIFNPLLTVQRLLGHANPSSTMIYLRYVEEADALVQRAFDAWDDPLKDYSDYLIETLFQPASDDRNP